MTTALEIITESFRESNLLAAEGVLTTTQITEALGKLNVLIASVFGFEVGLKLNEWPVGTAGTTDVISNWSQADWQLPPPNYRLMVSSTDPETITLPAFPDNGARIGLLDLTGTMSTHPVTLDANGKRIEGAGSLIVNIDDANLEWLYRADLGEWLRLTILGASDPLPFPLAFDTYFETSLAMRLNPRYGRSADQQTLLNLQRSLGQLRATYRQKRKVRVDEALLRMSETGQRYTTEDDTPARRDLWS